MTFIHLRKLGMPLVFLLSLVLIFEGMSVTVLATDSIPTADTEADTGAYVPEPTPDIGGGSLESDVIISPPDSFGSGGESEISPMATQILMDGVYCFKNKGIQGCTWTHSMMPLRRVINYSSTLTAPTQPPR